ncbi:MAG TPA: hypothetical protein VKB93_07545 [Thermoanaerobaculia bacterium]|nr:hypothetical protein [Thermoanaerobaculia bacterium]
MSASQLRIVAVVDVVSALATDTIDGAVWLLDSNKDGGSTGEGTGLLTTTVQEGDELIWTTMSLECEAFAAIDAIEIDPTYCDVSRETYPGTDIAYWLGRVLKDPGASRVPYNLRFALGSRVSRMSLSGPAIIGGRTDVSTEPAP